jgi:hypothetical protein
LEEEDIFLEKSMFGDDKNLLIQLNNQLDFFAKYNVILELYRSKNKEDQRKVGLKIVSLRKYWKNFKEVKKFILGFYKDNFI